MLTAKRALQTAEQSTALLTTDHMLMIKLRLHKQLSRQRGRSGCVLEYTVFGTGPTCDECWHAPANHVVEAHGAKVDVTHFTQHAVDVQSFQECPGKGAHVQKMQQDGNDGAGKLAGEERKELGVLAAANSEGGALTCTHS